MVIHDTGETSEENLVMKNFRYNKIEILIRECTIKMRAAFIPPTTKKSTFFSGYKYDNEPTDTLSKIKKREISTKNKYLKI